MAHRCVTATLHLLGGLDQGGSIETWLSNQRGRPMARPLILRGSGGDRTHVSRFKKPVHNHFATNPSIAVPPSGIEPEPLGLQPSAQTNYARVGCALRDPVIAQRGFRCPYRGTHHSLFDCQRCPAVRCGRTSGLDALADSASAPVAIRDLELETPHHDSQSWLFGGAGTRRPENAEGPLGRSSPGRPCHGLVAVHAETSGGGPPRCYPYPRYRRHTAPGASKRTRNQRTRFGATRRPTSFRSV